MESLHDSNKKLLIGILGNPKSGKATTWSTLFQKTVRTGKYERELEINDQKTNVFLINGAPLERKTEIKKILPKYDPQIVLCSFSYHKNVKQNFNYFIKKNYHLYIQWLNPGFNDEFNSSLFYQYGIIDYLLTCGAEVCVVNGKENPIHRVELMKNKIYGWNRNTLQTQRDKY